jgi:hypothetical protein
MSVDRSDAFTRYSMLQSTHGEYMRATQACVMPSDMREGWLAGSLTRYPILGLVNRRTQARGCACGPLPCHIRPASAMYLSGVPRETKSRFCGRCIGAADCCDNIDSTHHFRLIGSGRVFEKAGLLLSSQKSKHFVLMQKRDECVVAAIYVGDRTDDTGSVSVCTAAG